MIDKDIDGMLMDWGREMSQAWRGLGFPSETLTYRIWREGAGVLSKRPPGSSDCYISAQTRIIERVVCDLDATRRGVIVARYVERQSLKYCMRVAGVARKEDFYNVLSKIHGYIEKAIEIERQKLDYSD